MSELKSELKRLRLGLEGGAADDDFVERVMAACAEAPVVSKPRVVSSSSARAYGALLAVAASVALGLSVRAPERAARPTETAVARGSKPRSGLTAIVQAFVGRTPPGGVAPLLEGAQLRPGDGILLRYSNPSSAEVYLMVFALDERGSVHWIEPAYLNESENPTSLKLSRGVTPRVLPEVAEPEDAAPGLLRVYALLTRARLDVKSVEARVTRSSVKVDELFPEAEVEEWRCTWTP